MVQVYFSIYTCVLAFAWIIPVSVFADDEDGNIIEVYFIGGQSNAVGYGYDDLADEGYVDTEFTEGFDDTLFYGQYETLTDSCPSDFVSVQKGQGRCKTDGTLGSGAELGIAYALSSTGTKSAVIKYAWGATFLAPDTTNSVSKSQGTWTSPSYIEKYDLDTNGGLIGQMYTGFLSTVEVGLEKLTDLGYTPVLKGMWWMQGEAETNSASYSSAYTELLTCFIDDIRTDLTWITDEDQMEMPFGIGKIYRNPEYEEHVYTETIREAQQEVADSMTNVFTVDCTGLKQQDDWHFYASSQTWLGSQFIETIEAMEVSEQEDDEDTDGGCFSLLGVTTGASLLACILLVDAALLCKKWRI